MFTLKILKKFLKILNSDANPAQVAAGFAFGSVIGLTPFWSLHNAVVWILILLLRVHISSALVSTALFSVVGFFIDPLADTVGYLILADLGLLHGVWTALYNMPIVPFTHFNNTVVMGSLVISLVLFIPIMFLMKRFVIVYRARLRQRLEKIKVFQILKASKLYQWYESLRQ